MASYSEKLKNPRWQKKRLEVLQRDKFICQLCGDAETELQIHHKEYRKQYIDPWEYETYELTTLCRDCHHIVTQKEVNLNIDFPSAIKYKKPGNVLIIFIDRLGIAIYQGDETLIHLISLNHGIVQSIVHTVINYWLLNDKEELLNNPKFNNPNE